MSRRLARFSTAILVLVLPILLAAQAPPAAAQAPTTPQAPKAPAVAAAQPVIEKIILTGNDRLTQDAFLALTSLRPGTPYSEDRLREEYQKIWKSGLLEDLSVDVEDGKTGKIITFHIKERPIIASVEFTGSKTLTSSTVVDKLKENDADIKTGTVLDYARVKKTEAALRYVGAEKGYPAVVVTTKVQSMGRSQVALIFNVQEGPKARISKVKFLGAHAFSQSKLRYALKKTRSHWMFSWATRHDIYSEARYYEDLKGVRELYEAAGYLDVDIGDPIVDTKEDKKNNREWLTISIPINEGVSYKMGKLSFEGNHVFTNAELAKFVPLKQGKTLDKVLLGYMVKNVEARYGEKGYIYATATPIFDKHAEAKTADVSLSITEDQIYYVNRIEFSGNSSTRDYVLRREMMVYEQESFNYVRYQRGLYRLKQTGIFDIKDDPTIIKVPNTNTVNVAVKGTEANKNEFLFGGGYGGVNGFFISGSFRTYNFLGKGTTLSVNADVGKVQKLYSINYSDPWFFGKRIGATYSIYNTQLVYIQFTQKATGGSFSVSFPITDFSGWSIGYRYEKSALSNVTTASLSPQYSYLYNNSTTSAVFGGISFNTVNNPFRPMRGMSANLQATVAGQFLGGQNYYYQPTFTGSIYLPTLRKQNFAFHLNVGFVDSYDGHDIPLWVRYFIGGQDTLRGFGVRSIYPEVPVQGKNGTTYRYFIDPSSGTIEGGNRFYVLNSEYVFHIVEQVDVALYADVGNTYHERQKWEISNYRADAGLELRFFIPTFNVPLRLIYSHDINKRPNDDFSNFQFSIGLTF